MTDTLADDAQEQMIKTTWLLVRHGPVINPGNLIYGNADRDIDVSSQSLYAPLAKALPKSAVYLTSTKGRTHKTLQRVAEVGGFDTPAFEQVAEFDEQSFGDWEGQSWDDLFADGRSHAFWLAPAAKRPPNGESFEDLMARVAKGLERLSAVHAGKKIALVAHGGTIRAALALALGLDGETALRFSIDNCSLTHLAHLRLADGSTTWHVSHVNVSPFRPKGFIKG